MVIRSYENYAAYFWKQISFQSSPWYQNYFWMLTGVSLFFLLLEYLKPWRKNQPLLRKDFWLDTFYMYFNYFLVSLIILEAGSNVVVKALHDFQIWVGVDLVDAISVQSWPIWIQLLSYFILRDFIQWNVHRWLHRYNWLWSFHKVHHSVKEMGFAAHLRYHWMENVIYNVVQYLPLALIGFNLDHAFFGYAIATFIGHWNHANFTLNIGFLKYIFNSPQMHIWHHAFNLPESKRQGVNFGLSLSIWDYLFKTNYIPKSGRDITLGFEGDENFPKGILTQSLYGFTPDRTDDSKT